MNKIELCFTWKINQKYKTTNIQTKQLKTKIYLCIKIPMSFIDIINIEEYTIPKHKNHLFTKVFEK